MLAIIFLKLFYIVMLFFGFFFFNIKVQGCLLHLLIPSFAASHRIILKEVPYLLVPYKHTGGV